MNYCLAKALPQFRPMVWGNPELNKEFNIPESQTNLPIGEIWLLSGHPLYETTLENGLTINQFGHNLYNGKYPRFPILIKLVSTNQWLSVQVHPDDEYARNVEEEPWGKSEAWYFLTDGEFAICEDVEKMKEYINSGRINQLDEILTFVKVKKGTFVNIPAGTVHALGPNSTVIEVQQSSDLTYRIYDWGRPRETHLEKALQVSKTISLNDIVFENSDTLKTEYFCMQKSLSQDDLNRNNLIVHIPTQISKNYCAKLIINENICKDYNSYRKVGNPIEELGSGIFVTNFLTI
ncbi:phosphomannose isomerase [Fervidobacterium pennivorans DSM 9078]|jgi:mannose-6-phosphate isomerase|uniref:Phosphomannose isomerase n=1 Tax=Fervidobacterium pennivorans (strain DSM 9078 / Ven5) TaxID=771875 RepID=H9UDJ3_FERPD|nr:type I phosphomannose isomerase catalytic subunit [Fervidobacterium pennivorans]AFG35586.1 phosphomannose isomerase [Fervidobacterium pennivorans DSM 9078]QIV78789.1 class I mannose-6-phosphate isomerase [Fervidobacterium pennivorans subsp. keratinolyticus]